MGIGAAIRPGPAHRSEAPAAPSLSAGAYQAWLVVGLLLIPLQYVKLGPAQPAHLWALAFVSVLALNRALRITAIELVTFAMFIAVAIVNTRYGGYAHVKAGEQIIKFSLLYPCFYLIGRAYAERMGAHLPVGLRYLVLFIAVQYAIEYLRPPLIYRVTSFSDTAMHGTFLERGWLANYVLLVAYLWFLQTDRRIKAAVLMLAANVLIVLMTQSKTTLVQCGILLLLTMRVNPAVKLAVGAVGAMAYWWHFSQELSGDMLRVRMEEERGLAFAETWVLILRDFWGYGFGYVESYFGALWFGVKGLGLGANSVFCSPLDLAVIAGPAGVLFWLVFFTGAGVRSLRYLAPIAAGSLLNPFHQSELIYLFCGLLVTLGLSEHRARIAQRDAPRPGAAPADTEFRTPASRQS